MAQGSPSPVVDVRMRTGERSWGRRSTHEPARTVVVHPGALGDFVQALPAFAALRVAYRASELVLATGPDLAELARASGLFNAVIAYDTRALWRGRAVARIRALASLVRVLRRGRFEQAILFKASSAYAAVAFAAGIPVRVGFTRCGSVGSRLLTTAVPYAAGVHREDRLASLVRSAGADPEQMAPVQWPIDPGELDSALHTTRAGPRIVMAPGGARNAKEEMACRRWPIARYTELAERVAADEPDAHFVLLGGPGDLAETGALRTALGEARVTDLTARTSVAAARAVIDRTDVFVGNDSGLLHLAGTTSTPIVAVFGPTDPGEACPRRPGVQALWNPARASACMDDVTGELPPCVRPCCITRVDVAAVHAAVRGALAHPARDRLDVTSSA